MKWKTYTEQYIVCTATTQHITICKEQLGEKYTYLHLCVKLIQINMIPPEITSD